MLSSEVLAVWQPIGFSTHVISSRIAEKYGKLTSHTGTIDPSAEGVIIVLLGETRLKKYEYSEWTKGYEFELCFGFSTDTYDYLGIVEHIEPDLMKIPEQQIEKVLEGFKGDYTQKVPPFSAIKVEGKPLHWYARKDRIEEVELPERTGEILAIKLISIENRKFAEIVDSNCKRISKIRGTFRQRRISQKWQELAEKIGDREFQIIKISVEMTKGLYVRTLSQDISARLGVSGFVYSLVRTKNGHYTKNNSQKLKDIFGENYLEEYDFSPSLIY